MSASGGTESNLQARKEPHAGWILAMIGAAPEGKKELFGFQIGMVESAQSRREFLIDIRARGPRVAPEIAVGDEALGFWKALDEGFPRYAASALLGPHDLERPQLRTKVDPARGQIRPPQALAGGDPCRHRDRNGCRAEKVARCLSKDRESLLAFYDFPAEH